MSGVHISESKRCYNVIPSVHYFYVKTKILTDFQICTTVPLNHGEILLNRSNNSYISIEAPAPYQAGGFIIKYYFGISNITACR